MRRRVCTVGLVLACTAAALDVTSGDRAAAAPAAAITVDFARPGPMINPLLYGTNSRYTNNWESAWDRPGGRVRSGFAATYDDVFVSGVPGRTSLRFPGGTVANTFRWTWAIGSDRRTQVAYEGSGEPWQGDTFPSFGVDEAARFAEAHNSKLVYVYNFANGSAADAANLVEYLNAPLGSNPNGGTAWAQVRANNGHGAPYGVKYFEIGNEIAGDGQDFWLHTESYSDSQVAQRYINGADGHDGFSDYYSAMNAVAAGTGTDVEIFSPLYTAEFIEQMGSSRPYDGLAVHAYAARLPSGDAEYHDQAMDTARTEAARLLNIRNRMRAKVGGTRAADMDVVATEYGVLAGGESQRQSMTQALYVSKILLDFMSQEMAFAEKHITVELNEPEADGQWVIAPQSLGFIPSATARALKLFTHHFGNQLVTHSLRTPERPAAGGGEMLKELQVRASRNSSGRLYLAVANSNRGETGGGGAVTASVDVSGYDPVDRASVFTLNAPSYTSLNTPANPNTVVIETDTVTGVGDGTFAYTFPPHSVTVIELTR